MYSYSKGRLLILFVSALFVAYAAVGGILVTAGESGGKTFRELRVFSDVLSKIQSDYVDKPDVNRTLAGALLGLIDALDPRCSYVPASAVPAMRERNEKLAAETGAVLAKRYGYALVVAVQEGSPAEAAGLRSGDLIESVNGQPTSELSVAEVESLLRGPDGASLSLVIVRARNTEPIKLTVACKTLETPSVQARVLEPGIGYIRIPALVPGIAAQTAAKLRILSSGELSGLVLDLRGSATGSYDEAMKVADLFLTAGKQMGLLKDRVRTVKDYVSTDDASDISVPLVVLTMSDTSGPAESLAAALKENGRARILGEKTSGIASVQRELELEDGALLILTTELFYTPAGNAIQAENAKKAGVQPDQKVPDDNFVTNFYYQNPNLSGDEQHSRLLKEVEKLQVQKAVEYLKGTLKKAA